MALSACESNLLHGVCTFKDFSGNRTQQQCTRKSQGMEGGGVDDRNAQSLSRIKMLVEY